MRPNSKDQQRSSASFSFHFVEVRGMHYLRIDDVATFLRVLGSTEETDVRDRLDAATRQIILASTERKTP